MRAETTVGVSNGRTTQLVSFADAGLHKITKYTCPANQRNTTNRRGSNPSQPTVARLARMDDSSSDSSQPVEECRRNSATHRCRRRDRLLLTGQQAAGCGQSPNGSTMTNPGSGCGRSCRFPAAEHGFRVRLLTAGDDHSRRGGPVSWICLALACSCRQNQNTKIRV